MAFTTALKIAEDISTVQGTVVNIFVLYEMHDDATTETRLVPYNFTPAELSQIIGAGGAAARRLMARSLVKPKVKQAFLDWVAERAARPVVTATDLTQVSDPPLSPADVA